MLIIWQKCCQLLMNYQTNILCECEKLDDSTEILDTSDFFKIWNFMRL